MANKQVAVEIDIRGTKDVIRLRKEIRETNKALKEASGEAYDELATDLVRLKSELKGATKAQRQAVDAFTATDKGVGAYSRLSAQLRVARNNLKDLKASGQTTGEEVEKLTAEVNQLDTSLKDIDRSVGQTNREVGAYEEAVRKAIGITDAQTGAFTRLEGKARVLRKAYKDVAIESGKNSKEAKQLAKELKKVEKELKAVGDEGQRTGGRVGGLRTQLKSLGPAASGLASGFLIFAELPQILGDLSEGLETVGAFLSSSVALNKRFNESLQEGAVQLAQERIELDSNFGSVMRLDGGTRERTEAVELLQDQYPEYLGNLDAETVTNEELEAAQRGATAALIEDIAAQQTRLQATKIIEEYSQAIADGIEIQRESEGTVDQIVDGLVGATTAVGDFFLGFTGTFQTDVTEIYEGLNEAQKKNLKEQAKGLGDFQEQLEGGFSEINDALKDAGIDLATLQAGTAEASAQAEEDRAKKAAARAADRSKREQDRAVKAARQKADRIAAEEERGRERLLQAEIRDEANRTKLLLSLTEQIVQAELAAREDGLKKELAIEENASKKRADKLKADFKDATKAVAARQAEFDKLFGKGSEKAVEFAKTSGLQLEKIKADTDKAIEGETSASLKRQSDIRKSFADKEAQEEKQELQKFLQNLAKQRTVVEQAVEGELLTIRQLRAKGEITEQQAEQKAFDARIKNIKAQLKQLTGEEFALTSQAEFGAEVAQEEFDKIVLARKKLNTEMAELEGEQTKNVEANEQDRTAKRLKGIESALNTASEALGFVDQFAAALGEREDNRLQALADERAANIEALNERLSESSGLEKAFIQQRVDEETKAAEAIAESQIRANKRQAVAQKAFAIGQALINGALAVTNILANTIDPTPVQAFKIAAIAGAIAATVAQVAVIAATPVGAKGGIVDEHFAKGGIVHGPSHAQGGVKFAVGGRVKELEGNEAVMTKGAVRKFGPQLSAMNVAGGGRSFFQAGGVVSPPISAPALSKTVGSAESAQQLIEQNAQLLAATNRRIDRIQVEYNPATETAVQKDRQDRKEIKARATL